MADDVTRKAIEAAKADKAAAGGEIKVPPSLVDPETWKMMSRFQFIYSLAGLSFGLVCVLGGIVLFLNGISGSTSWTAKIIGAESHLSDAAPGALLFVVGLFIVFMTRFSVSVRK